MVASLPTRSTYQARLLECVASGYLQRYPSRSYTLNRLGGDFANYLDETRPDRRDDGEVPDVAWPNLLIDLARLEWASGEVFDGPGSKTTGPTGAGAVPEVPRVSLSRPRLLHRLPTDTSRRVRRRRH